MRPRELAEDDTPMVAVVRHAVDWIEARGDRFDAICLLQPTSPLRAASDIDASVSLLEEQEADSVVSVLPVPAEHNPHWVYFQTVGGWLRLSTGEDTPIARRQDLPPAFHREGSIYVTRRDVVVAGSLYGERCVGYAIDPGRSVNINTPDDWARAETRLEALR
jgi:CMP-N-acetylneuraminic acid synthetase